MSAVIGASLAQGQTLKDLTTALGALKEGGKPVSISVEGRCVPYLGDTVAGWTDGPPSSTVLWLLSAKDPQADAWRRWTISRVSGGYQVGCFPTHFHNAQDPLAPGVPPSSSKRR
ncbi:MAG: hypothetical protein EXR69_12375 [Myxococcales bacterium]|nr:hypothetical protein [Myxococcales bacterium]